ncbi:uncharacterized protein RHO17_000330 isoform 2-T2 [Thomomys bottae]
MLLCCCQRSGDSSLRHERYGCLARRCRCWISAKLQIQYIRSFSRKKARKIQGNSDECDHESAQTLNEPCNVWILEEGLLETLLITLIPAYKKGDLFYVGNFLHNFRQWGTMEQLLDILLKKSIHRSWEEDEQVKNIVCSMFTMWMDFYPSDFYEVKNCHTLTRLKLYMRLHMPASELLFRLHILFDQLEECATSLGHRRRASPELQMKNPPVELVTDGHGESSLHSRKHGPSVENTKQIWSPVVDIPCALNAMCDTVEPTDTLAEEKEQPEFTVYPESVHVSQSDTPLTVQAKEPHAGLMENVPSLCVGEGASAVSMLDSLEENELILTEYPDPSVSPQENQSPVDNLESIPLLTQEGHSVSLEEGDTSEDSEVELLPEGNLEASLDLELPCPLPKKISLYLALMIVVKCSLYFLF